MQKLIIIAACLPLMILGQEPNKQPTNNHALGLNLDVTTGYGFSYRYNMKQWTGEVTLLPVFSTGSSLIISGFSVMYNTNFHDKVSPFLYIGGQSIYSRMEYTPSQYNINHAIAAGLGGGVNINIIDLFDLSIKAGYALYSSRLPYSSNLVTFSSGLGIFYKF